MTTDRPFRLGVTGGIASGKSSVMTILAELGAETIDADRVYHGLIEPGQPLFLALVDRWGQGILAPDGSIDRRTLGRIVFSDSKQLAELDRLTHPAIRIEIDNLYNASNATVVAIDAVKLIESGHADQCDAVWLIIADPPRQIERLVSSRRLSAEDAARRVAAQPPVEARLARSDTAIDNNGSPADLRQQVLHQWQRLLPNRTERGAGTTTTPRFSSDPTLLS